MEPMFEVVKRVLGALPIPGLDPSRIEPHSLLIEDVGLESLLLVELTLGLEAALGVAEFPLQDWLDDMSEQHRPLTVEALAQCCERVVRIKQGTTGETEADIHPVACTVAEPAR